MEETKSQETSIKKKTKTRVWIVIFFIIALVIYSFVDIRGDYLNMLELGTNYVDVFKQNMVYNIIVLIVNFIIVFLSVYITNKLIKKGLKAFFEEDKITMPKLPNKSIALIIATIVSIVTLPIIMQKVMLMCNTAWFGINDPIFNIDIGYFFFKKPFIEIVLFYIILLTVFLTVYTAVYYIIAFNKYFDGINLQTLRKNTAIKQLTVNIMIIAVCVAGLTFLNSQDILFEKFLNTNIGNESVIYGAGFTDVTIKLWGYRILSVLIVLAVYLALRFFKNGKNKKAVVSLAIIPIYLVLLFIIMTGLQFLFVNSNELDREKQYIAYNIENTKKAYSINIEENEIKNSGAITYEQVVNNSSITENIPIITQDVTLKTLEEYQTQVGYYSYNNTNLSKYKINGENKYIYLSPREMVSDNRRTYNSKTYEYTHGFGVILSDATKTDENGNIEYIQKSFDRTDEKVEIKEPRIYFGTQTNSNIIINSKNKKEYDYPITSSTNAENTYTGEAGLKLNFLDRLILGIKIGDLKIAFNNNITENTKIITSRNIINRAKLAMPYLVYDPNPYMVIRDYGRLVWVLDAYTISDSYPYSQESTIDVNGNKTKINYIRNSVKVIVDAYNGTMQFYITDRTDPIIMAYQKIYKNLFMSQDKEIPQDIKKHMVYPKYLYDIQANILTRYHNVQTEVLYRNDDVWNIAKTGTTRTTNSRTNNMQNIGTTMESYYTVLKTQNMYTEELGLVLPFTPKDKQNINAYLVGKYNGQNILTLYKFKSDDNVIGIMQLENQIESDESISQEIESINKTGSKLIRNMIVVPVESTLLYVEPIYQVLLNESQVPVLKKVIVASGNKMAIADNLKDAIENLVSQQATELEVENTDSEEGLVEAIIKANKNLEESSINKNWELMGKDIGRLQNLIKQLEELKNKNNQQKINDTNVLANEIDIDNSIPDDIIY